MSDRDLDSIGRAIAISQGSMLSGGPWSSMSSNQWTSMPINIGQVGDSLPGSDSTQGASSPYRDDGPVTEEITVRAPPYSGDLVLPGGDTVSGNMLRTQDELRDYMEKGRRMGGSLGALPLVGPFVSPLGERAGSALGEAYARARWVNRVRPWRMGLQKNYARRLGRQCRQL